MLGALVLMAMLAADVIRIFYDRDDFDATMLLVRPVATFIGVLLCGGSFWGALLGAIAWGVLGTVVAFELSERFGNRSEGTADENDDAYMKQKPALREMPRVVPAQVEAETKTNAVPSGSFTFSDGILPQQDQRYRKGKASDGTVYYGDRVIGYYEIPEAGRVNIYRDFDRGLIGYVWGEEVFLSREAQYEREKMYTPAPVPMTLNFAEIRGSYIKDHLSYAYIGDVKGDPLAAAAAMVCLIYECHMEYKHALFYRNWNK